MKYEQKPRDVIWKYMIENSLDKDAKDPGLYTLAMMDGGIRKIRPEKYSGLLKKIFEQGKEKGNVSWYLVECLSDEETPVRLYIDLDLLTLKALGADDIRRITSHIEREVEEMWDCHCPVKAKTCVTAPNMAIDVAGYVSPSGRVLKKRDKETKKDVNDFFAGEPYQDGIVKKMGVHWYFPQIVAYPRDIIVFASHLISVLRLREPEITWKDALDLSVYKGSKRGAFRLPYTLKCMSCKQKSPFVFDKEKEQYKLRENISLEDKTLTRPPTMVCGTRQGQRPNTTLPCENDHTLYPKYLGCRRARELSSNKTTKIKIGTVTMEVICKKCGSFGHYNVNGLSYQPFDDNDNVNPRDYSIFCLPKEDATPKKEVFDKVSKLYTTNNDLDNKAIMKSIKSGKRHLNSAFDLNRFDMNEEIWKKLVVALRSFKAFDCHPWEKMDIFDINPDDIRVGFKLDKRLLKHVTSKSKFSEIYCNRGPVVRIFITDRKYRYCISRSKKMRGSCFCHSSNGAYIEVSCLGIRTYCFDDDCKPDKEHHMFWRQSDECKDFWKKFSAGCEIYKRPQMINLLKCEVDLMNNTYSNDLISTMLFNIGGETSVKTVKRSSPETDSSSNGVQLSSILFKKKQKKEKQKQ